jgi:haloacetate dehalogenase
VGKAERVIPYEAQLHCHTNVNEVSPLLESFATHDIQVTDATIHCQVGGSGRPLLLLHGCPQTHVMWHKVAPALANHFTVVASDLRGYGDSSKPRGLPDHSNYSFRAMATDQVEVMTSLGFKSFSAVGHDRGARVLHRMALDQPETLTRVALLDILPTSFLYAHADRDFAAKYWEWFFFIQAHDFPEQMLSGNPEALLRYELGALADRGVVVPEAWREYLRVLSSPDAMHGMCEDYRAGASIDLEHDAADASRKILCPLMALWGNQNPVWRRFDMLEVWRKYAESVIGCGLDAGHYLAEEAPAAVLAHLLAFLSGRTTE